MDTRDTKAVLAFVNRWGLPSNGWYAEVTGTRAWLQAAKKAVDDLHALQNRRSALPTISERQELAFDVSSLVGGMHFAVRATPDGFRPVFQATRLADVIGLRLFELATSAERLRQCAYGRCRAFFIPDRRDQLYCKTAGEQICARRASLEKLRARRKKESKRRQRHSRPAAEQVKLQTAAF